MPSTHTDQFDRFQLIVNGIMVVLSPEEQHKAALRVCSSAKDAEDAEYLLTALGLV